ncbi:MULTISPECIES: hypothetical protein [unclassified Streptomyces]|uniref:hypothetical protein n=1 Tax=unclassified Streptomyces TaxID=2593676 RepID=UPI002E360CA7|nr:MULTISPECIES: hypothetical protein [unclassified Streptomyces]
MSPEFDGVGAAREFPAVGAFVDVGDDDVVDEAVLEVVVAQVTGEPEGFDVAPVAAARVDAEGGGAAGAAFAFSLPVLTRPLISNWPSLIVSGRGAAGTMTTFS